MLAVAILGAFLIILVTLRVKERPALSQHEGKMSFKDYLTFTFTSKSGLILIAQNFMRVLVQSITIGSIFYVADYLIRINSLVLLAAVFAPMIIGIAVSGQIRRRMGALGALQLYLILGGLGLLSVMIMPAAFLPISYMLVGFGMAGPEALTYLLFAQVIDEDELRSGQRREGAFFGTNALLTKPAQSLAIAIPPFILEASGFVTREANGGLIFLNQGESALTGIRIFAGLIPGIAFLAGAAILLTYPIKGSRLKEQEEKILALHQKKEADYAPEA
jgi:GPH family glycoside/pentoside/hexuronide:cation symporter